MRRKKVIKPNVISMRITDAEMESVKALMDLTGKRASVIMRDALDAFKAQWAMTGAAGSPAESR